MKLFNGNWLMKRMKRGSNHETKKNLFLPFGVFLIQFQLNFKNSKLPNVELVKIICCV